MHEKKSVVILGFHDIIFRDEIIKLYENCQCICLISLHASYIILGFVELFESFMLLMFVSASVESDFLAFNKNIRVQVYLCC